MMKDTNKTKTDTHQVLLYGRLVNYDAINHSGSKKQAIRDYKAHYKYIGSGRTHYINDKEYKEKKPAYFFVRRCPLQIPSAREMWERIRDSASLPFKDEVNMIRKGLMKASRYCVNITGKLLSSRMKKYLSGHGYTVTEEKISKKTFKTSIDFYKPKCQCRKCCDDDLLMNSQRHEYVEQPCESAPDPYFCEDHCNHCPCDECDDDLSEQICLYQPCDESALIHGEVVRYDRVYKSSLIHLLKWAKTHNFTYIGAGRTHWNYGRKIVENCTVHFFREN